MYLEFVFAYQVKVDGKTQALLDEHKAKKRLERSKESESNGGNDSREEGETDDDSIDDVTMREDRVAKAGLDAIVREYHDELMKEPASNKGKDILYRWTFYSR